MKGSVPDIKALSARRAPRCGKHQFRAKSMVNN